MNRLLLLVLLPLSVLAGSLTLNWTAPTKNTDGSTLTDGAGYKIYCAATSAGVATATPVAVSGIATQTYTMAYAAGPVFCNISTTNIAGAEGPKSNIATGTVPASVANPPTNVTLTASSGIAYRMRQSVDGYSIVRIGTVPTATLCDTTHSIDGYSIVPRDTVTLDSPLDTKPLIVLSVCS